LSNKVELTGVKLVEFKILFCACVQRSTKQNSGYLLGNRNFLKLKNPNSESHILTVGNIPKEITGHLCTGSFPELDKEKLIQILEP